MTESGRRCTRCGTLYDAEEVASGQAFEVRRGVDASSPHSRGQLWKKVCRPCVDTERDERKGADRWAVKANDAIRRHAIRLRVSKSLGSDGDSWHDPHLTSDKLITLHGWRRTQISHDAQFQYGNGCSYCHRKYVGMGHEAADITLDIFDPRLPPEYGTNTRWCCMTCQRQKSLLTPVKWAMKQRCYRKWDAARSMPAESLGFLF